MNKIITIIFAVFFIFSFAVIASAREWVDSFTPINVTVADGYLQIQMPFSKEIEGCANSAIIVLADDHKYFESYLSISIAAFMAGKKIRVAIGSPCLSNNNWPQISVMRLQE